MRTRYIDHPSYLEVVTDEAVRAAAYAGHANARVCDSAYAGREDTGTWAAEAAAWDERKREALARIPLREERAMVTGLANAAYNTAFQPYNPAEQH